MEGRKRSLINPENKLEVELFNRIMELPREARNRLIKSIQVFDVIVSTAEDVLRDRTLLRDEGGH